MKDVGCALENASVYSNHGHDDLSFTLSYLKQATSTADCV